MTPSYEELYDLWFPSCELSEENLAFLTTRWFSKSWTFDAELKVKFENYFTFLEAGQLHNWLHSKKGILCYIILCDQISRNIFRGTPRAYSYDSISENLALALVKNKKHFNYNYLERIFIYLPLEHAEEPSIQKISLSMFKKLKNAAPNNLLDFYLEFYEYAIRHHRAIKQFGRFPSRNEVLQRESSEQELAFLKVEKNNF